MFLIKTSFLLFCWNTSTRRSSSTVTTKAFTTNDISRIHSRSKSKSTSSTKINLNTSTENDFFKKFPQSTQQLFSLPFPFKQPQSLSRSSLDAQSTIESFISTMNDLSSSSSSISTKGKGKATEIETMVTTYFDSEVEFIDTSFYKSVQGTDALLKHFLLFQDSDSSSLSIHNDNDGRKIVIDDIVAGKGSSSSRSDSNGGNDDDDLVSVCVQYHLETDGGIGGTSTIVPDSTGITFYTLRENKIMNLFNVIEPPSPKPGNAGLKLLEAASTVLGKNKDALNENDDDDDFVKYTKNENVVETYFNSWNERKMDNAIKCFTSDCVYQDLQYDTPFEGEKNMEQHLNNVAKCLPSSFRFQIDELVKSDNGSKVGVLWHVESDGDELPFTRGCSFYTTTTKKQQQLIQTGTDIPEPAVIKSGAIDSTFKKFTAEPVRFIPLAMWISYMYIVFLSDGILPGANALQLEQRTWEEVRDLSLNFFLVSPVLNLPFAPVVHPMLEGVFNLLLVWAGMFAGFLSDERKNKPNLLEFGPIVVGMQFLTSAFLLPYLAFRSPEQVGEQDTIYKEDITGSIQATVGEWKPLGGFLGSVGSASIVWAFLARPEFGAFSERYSSFLELLSIDRVGSSFLVDLAIFALFQGWFVDDDMKRRGVGSSERTALKIVAKFVPFFGLALYLSFRPDLPSRDEQVE